MRERSTARRVVVLGYHEVGYVCLEELIKAGEEVVAVVTHHDDPNENGWYRSVAELARTHSIPVHTPNDVNKPIFVSSLMALQPDILFSLAFRQIVSPDILAIPPRGCINLHGSLLPKYRGRAPVNWVLVNGETETGATLHYMEAKADRGEIISQRVVTISDTDTAISLHHKMTEASRELFRETWPLKKSGRAPRIPQDHSLSSYFGRRTPADGKIDWVQPARAIYNLIRAVTHPYPGAFTFHNGRKLFVWWGEVCDLQDEVQGQHPGEVIGVDSDEAIVVASGEGALQVISLHLDGEEELGAGEFARRHHIGPGARLGS